MEKKSNDKKASAQVLKILRVLARKPEGKGQTDNWAQGHPLIKH